MTSGSANVVEFIGDEDQNISAVTQANPAEVTVADTADFLTGDTVDIAGVVGMTELNGNTYTITVTSGTTFTLDGVDSTGFTAYTSGGVATRNAIAYPTGFWFEVIQEGAGVTTVQGGSGVQVHGSVAIPGDIGGAISAQYGLVRVTKAPSGNWTINGDIGAIS